MVFRTLDEFSKLELNLIFLEKQIYSGINEMQIPTKLQNVTNQNNFPYWNDILNIRSQFTKPERIKCLP